MNSSTEITEKTSAEKLLWTGRWQRFIRILKHNRGLAIGLVLLIFLLLIATIGPLLSQYGPYDTSAGNQYQAPSGTHWFGTDQYGRDILTRVIYGARLDIFIALSVALFSLVVGALIGTVAGYFGGWVDLIISRIVDVMLSFPAFILAMGVTAVLGNKMIFVIFALGLAYMPYFIRLTRAEMLKLRNAEFADAARSLGVPKWKIMLVHLLPNAMGPALTQSTLTMGWALLDAAGLSFIGLGIKAPTAEWGVMIGDGVQDIFSGNWWTSFFPGLAILVTVLSFNLIGNGLRGIKGGK